MSEIIYSPNWERSVMEHLSTPDYKVTWVGTQYDYARDTHKCYLFVRLLNNLELSFQFDLPGWETRNSVYEQEVLNDFVARMHQGVERRVRRIINPANPIKYGAHRRNKRCQPTQYKPQKGHCLVKKKQ